MSVPPIMAIALLWPQAGNVAKPNAKIPTTAIKFQKLLNRINLLTRIRSAATLLESASHCQLTMAVFPRSAGQINEQDRRGVEFAPLTSTGLTPFRQPGTVRQST